MMLCCLHDGFNGTVGLSLSQVLLESVSEDGQLTIGLEATEGFLGLQQAGGGPSERHLGVPPAFDVAGDLAHRAERVLDDVGAGERAPEFVRQAEADDGEDLPPAPPGCCPRRPVPHAPDAGPGCARAARPCLRRPGPRPDGAPS